jgi:hypothetical protein
MGYISIGTCVGTPYHGELANQHAYTQHQQGVMRLYRLQDPISVRVLKPH